MYKVKIANVDRVLHQESNSYFLDVEFQVLQPIEKNGKQVDEVVHSHKEALPVDASREDIEEAALTVLNGFIRDEELKAANAAHEASLKHTAELKEELTGAEFEPKTVETKE